MAEPRHNKGQSKQNYRTPTNFLDAVRAKFGIKQFSIDLAAEPDNAVCPDYYTKEMDTLSDACPWNSFGGWNWLNPEYANIGPYVEKAYRETLIEEYESKNLLLLPAGVGSNWWRDWVHGKCKVHLLNGRLCFIHDWEHTIDPASLKPGRGPARFYTSPPIYPKDCVLLQYQPGCWVNDYQVWTWPTL